MDRDTFWALVEQARPPDNDPHKHDARLVRLLARRTLEEIASFGDTFWDLMSEAYRRDLWSAYSFLRGGCSDDGFTYCRARLVMHGRDVFETVLASPDYLAEITRDRWQMEHEDFLDMAERAYERATGGGEMPWHHFGTKDCRLKGRWAQSARTRRRRWPTMWALVTHPPKAEKGWLTWRSGLVPAMARGIEKERRWADLPVLADALEEAGCAEPLMLGHCRAGTRHARTCWVVNSLLGRK